LADALAGSGDQDNFLFFVVFAGHLKLISDGRSSGSRSVLLNDKGAGGEVKGKIFKFSMGGRWRIHSLWPGQGLGLEIFLKKLGKATK
jgi:hypothetical protein